MTKTETISRVVSQEDFVIDLKVVELFGMTDWCVLQSNVPALL